MKKVKVNKEVFDALKNAESFFNGNLESVVIDIIDGYKYKAREKQPLNAISKDKILKIYKYGYELEKTAEQKLLCRWKESNNMQNNAKFFYREGILDVLSDFGIKVKGINSEC